MTQRVWRLGGIIMTRQNWNTQQQTRQSATLAKTNATQTGLDSHSSHQSEGSCGGFRSSVMWHSRLLDPWRCTMFLQNIWNHSPTHMTSHPKRHASSNQLHSLECRYSLFYTIHNARPSNILKYEVKFCKNN
jgi:hypothetical protein